MPGRASDQDASYRYLMIAGVAAMAAIALIVYSLSAGKADGGGGAAKQPGGGGAGAAPPPAPASKWAARAGQLWGDRRLKPSSSASFPDEKACYEHCAGNDGRWAHWFADKARCDCFDYDAAGQPYAGCWRKGDGVTWSALDPPRDECNENVTLNTCARGGFSTESSSALQDVATSLGCGIACIGDARDRAAVWDADKAQCHCLDWRATQRCHDANTSEGQTLWVPAGLLNCSDEDQKTLPKCSEPGECACSSEAGGCVPDDRFTCVGAYAPRCGGDGCSSCACVAAAPPSPPPSA